jgi:hypothetical protein
MKMKLFCVFFSLFCTSVILNGQTHPNLLVHGAVTWLDDTHVRVVYDWSNDWQLLDWNVCTPGTTISRDDRKVMLTGGSTDIRAMHWKLGIKCSRIIAENVKTGSNLHVNIYTNLDRTLEGHWKPSPTIGLVLRGTIGTSVAIVDANVAVGENWTYLPDLNPDTYDINISSGGLSFRSFRENKTYTLEKNLAPEFNRLIALGAYRDNTQWGRVTIEGEIDLGTVTSVGDNSETPVKIIMSNGTVTLLLNEQFISGKADLINLYGKRESSRIIDSNILKFDTSSLASGLYFIILSKGENRKVQKIIIN